MAAAIEAKGLVKTYPGGVPGARRTEPRGGSRNDLRPAGPNRAGRSTTVKILTTLSRTDSGEAWVTGHDVLRDPHGVRRAIALVSQRSSVHREATGRANLTLQDRSTDFGP
jgi:ABC-2 type transport system ATP-binding protein